MKANQLSFSKSEAVSYLSRNRRNGVIYLRKFDVDVVFRKGKLEDEKISSVRYKEDDRPQTSFNKRTNRDETKKNDIVTYKMDGKNELYVLAKSGGVSLFDGMSTKVQLGKKDCWWVKHKMLKYHAA